MGQLQHLTTMDIYDIWVAFSFLNISAALVPSVLKLVFIHFKKLFQTEWFCL